MKERGPGAATCFGDLNRHDTEVEELVDEPAGDRRLLVHLADERPYLAVSELKHAVAKQRLVLVEGGQSAGRVRPWHWISIIPAAGFGDVGFGIWLLGFDGYHRSQ